MQSITNNDGVPLSSDLYKLAIPPSLTDIMLDYLDFTGLNPLFNHCVSNAPRSFKSDMPQCTLLWDVRRRPLPSCSDMYWISPANYDSHYSMLSRLGSGGFHEVLKAIGSVLETHIPHLTVYSLTFLLVSFCEEQRFHTDNDDSLNGDVWTVIFPLILVPNSNPELVVRHSVYKSDHFIKYKLGEALIWGPNTEHSTASVAYDGGYRVCVAVNLAFINALNVKQITLDCTQQYPPKSQKLLLQWAQNPHWRRSVLNDEVNLPSVTEVALLGSEWLSKYNMLVQLKEGNSGIMEGNYPPALRQWMAHQRYCYALKYGLRVRQSESSRFIASATRTLTFYRESKLREIGFLFTLDRDEGSNQGKWVEMFHKLVEFHIQNGHLNVCASSDKKLYYWIRTQKSVLAGESNLSSTKKRRKQMLLELGMEL